MNKDRLLKRIDELLDLGQKTLSTSHQTQWFVVVKTEEFSIFKTLSISFIRSIFGEKHPHYIEFCTHTKDHSTSGVKFAVGILISIKNELEGGWLSSIKGIIAAEVFTDFIEMAEHLLESGYKDPAAVLIGSVLEDHLRHLCKNNGIPVEDIKDGKTIPLRADRLNTELTKAGIYSLLDQKQITAWLDLRNKAAHGKYGEFNSEQVQMMISGILEFIARVSI